MQKSIKKKALAGLLLLMVLFLFNGRKITSDFNTIKQKDHVTQLENSLENDNVLLTTNEIQETKEVPFEAIVSIVVLILIIVVSIINSKVNIGVLSIASSIIIGGLLLQMKGSEIMALFPSSLFMMLFGVTFFFGIIQLNGTMEKIIAYVLYYFRKNIKLIPLIVFLLTTFIVSVGPGNIAGTALIAPIAMLIAKKIKMPAFLMTLIVVGAANGAAFSPLAPTGIISNGIVSNMMDPLGIDATELSVLSLKVFINSFVVQGVVTWIGFFLTGGIKWLKSVKKRNDLEDLSTVFEKPSQFSRKQKIALSFVAFLIISLIVVSIPTIKVLLPEQIKLIFNNVGAVAFVLAAILLLIKVGESKKVIASIPWNVIIMVTGVSILIKIVELSGGLLALTNLITSISGPVSINGVIALVAGGISAYSSSSGVVMPMFLPMVPNIVNSIGGNPIAIISSINVGSHLVDTSPLSTLGAICISSADEKEDKQTLFRHLLSWGLSMAIIGAGICYIFFGILNL